LFACGSFFYLLRDYWKDFIENPVKDFVMPSGRSPEQDKELGNTLTEYIAEFH
jgi:hypothetical protein